MFHDFTLDRLTHESGPFEDLRADRLGGVALLGSADRIPLLSAFLATVDGRVPLVCEIKSRFDGDLRLADRVADLAAAYRGPLALKSFDPQVIAHLRSHSWAGPLGMVAEAAYDDPEWSGLAPQLKRNLSHFLHFGETRPDFLSYHVGDLPNAGSLSLPHSDRHPRHGLDGPHARAAATCRDLGRSDDLRGFRALTQCNEAEV